MDGKRLHDEARLSAHVFQHKVQCTQPEPGRKNSRFWAALESAGARKRRCDSNDEWPGERGRSWLLKEKAAG